MSEKPFSIEAVLLGLSEKVLELSI